MRHLSRTAIACLAAGALASLAGCGHTPPGSITTASEAVRSPTAATAPGSADSATTAPSGDQPFVAHPLDISDIASAPCGTITDSDLTPLALGPGLPTTMGGVRSCRWRATADEVRQVDLVFTDTMALRSQYAAAQAHLPESGPGSGATGKMISGYPAVSTPTRPGGRYSCAVDVAVAGEQLQQGFRLYVLGSTKDSCPVAEHLAATIIESIAHH